MPEKPNDEVPAIARVVVQSMILPGMMTFGWQLQVSVVGFFPKKYKKMTENDQQQVAI